MKFEITSKNFELDRQLLKRLDKTLSKLKHALKPFSVFEKQGNILLEKRPRKKEFIAKINFYLPKHHVATHDTGETPEQALHKAADDARDKVLKVKDLIKGARKVF